MTQRVYSRSKTANLDEVSLIRPILIVLMVLYHSMAIHTGNWDMPQGVFVIPVYMVIGKLSYAFMLEAFVFLSGYVWAYQREVKGNNDNLWQLIVKKARRLLLPSVIFGFFYIILFEQNSLSLHHIIEGPGHLWFLPMLFECFIIVFLILETKAPQWIVLPLLLVLALFRPTGLPIQLSYTLYYLFFFYFGYCVKGYSEAIRTNVKMWHVLAGWLAFIVFFFGLVYVRGFLISNMSESKMTRGGVNLCQVVYSCVGTFSLYITALIITKKKALSQWVVTIGGLCMGVYILQQFVLKWLYYYTILPSVIPGIALPWCSFLITLLSTTLVVYIVRKTRIGRNII